MHCRICLDDEKPLYQPCTCRGTMAYVHQACLFTWIETKGLPTCELCKTTYRIAYDRPLEHYEHISFINGYFMVYPSWHILNTCILQILLGKLFAIAPQAAYFYSLVIYQSFYMAVNVGYLIGTLHRPRIYVRYAKSSILVALFVHFHIWAWMILIFQKKGTFHLFMVLSIANTGWLGIYPILHSRTIQQMNSERQRILL